MAGQAVPSGEQTISKEVAYHYEDTVTRYANNLVVQHTDSEFIISFFEIIPPIVLGSEEQIRAQLEASGPLHARCVARIVVSPERMPSFIGTLQANLDKFLSRKEQQA